ncbi:hypothetical protein BJ508DRAFT_320498 [Ascobolus immersus RN42]|uniref:F-box domain-containing protein n=1 Tax=Ascobolus immersus RN42 TaxID=1160509 RepID=A0A3N4IMY2_ASCIM|nr:hypothetical protein BJ508DRAFT_320498 [Ascobolus immersus RN42]
MAENGLVSTNITSCFHSVSSAKSSIFRLPNELLCNIFIRIDDAHTYVNLYRVCQRFYGLAHDRLVRNQFAQTWLSSHCYNTKNYLTNFLDLEYAVRHIRLHGMAGITSFQTDNEYGRTSLGRVGPDPKDLCIKCTGAFYVLSERVLFWPPRVGRQWKLLRITRRYEQQRLTMETPDAGWTMASIVGLNLDVEDVVIAKMIYDGEYLLSDQPCLGVENDLSMCDCPAATA